VNTPTSLSRDEVRALDRIAVERWGVCGLVLMENAGRQVADQAVRMLGDATDKPANYCSELMAGKSVAIVAGAGNNGGDGYVAARHLAIRGVKTITFLVSPESKITGDAAENLKIIRKLGLRVRQLVAGSLAELAGELRKYDLVIDAIGGTGITGPLRGDLAAAVEQVNLAARPVLAVDIPTGLDCDTGQAPGPVVRATVTVTMVARKKGFDAPGAKENTGEVVVADIGVPPDLGRSAQ
jgi:NAD(P)H-hydrate epimerase